MIKRLLNKKQKNKKITAERAVLTSLFVDLTDIVINAIVAFITGSVVILAETIQGIADSASDILIYVGLKHSKKPVDKDHPFGYGKSLYVWTFMAGVIIFGFTSIATFYLGFHRFLNPEEIRHVYLAFIVLTIFIITNGYALTIGFKRILDDGKIKDFLKIYKKSHFIETKTTFTLDLIGTFSAIIGLIALIIYQITGDLRFDGLGAMAIGITLAGLTFFLLNNIRHLLIGKRASLVIEKRIIDTILSVRNVKEVLDLKTMIIGLGKILVNVEIKVNNNLKTKQIERLMDRIKQKVKKNIKEVYHIQIELETPESEMS